jgi:hypothetical protein
VYGYATVAALLAVIDVEGICLVASPLRLLDLAYDLLLRLTSSPPRSSMTHMLSGTRIILILPQTICAIVVMLAFVVAYALLHYGGLRIVHGSSAAYGCGMCQ